MDEFTSPSPETSSSTPPAPGPPPDPYAPDWSAEDWHEAAKGIEMEPGAFRELFPPAREALQVAPDLVPLLESEELGGRALGDAPHMIEAFGRFSLDRRQDRQQVDRLRQQDAMLAQQLGQRPSPPPRVAELRGERLQTAIAHLLDRYLPSTAVRNALGYLESDAQLLKGLAQLAQDQYRRQQESQYYGEAVERRRGQLEQPGTVKVLPGGQRASNDQLDAAIDETRRALVEADKLGRHGERERHLRTLERLYKSRYGGGDAA
jgi:hypothetical protein